MKISTQRLSLAASMLLAATAVACSGGASDEATGTITDGIVARPAARLFLTDAVLTKIRARATAGDAGWTALKAQCDGWATGTMNAPNGQTYPDFPNVGQGYQGEEYVAPILGLGLCYRVTTDSDPTAAQKYAAAGGRLLDAMSTPVSEGGQAPSTDSGYGIRNYGVGMAFGYDWLYPALSATTRSRVIASLDTWIDWYDASGFSRNQAIGNYFVGYMLAKTATALATEGENPKADAYWTDVETHLWGTLMKPAFSRSMTGGGWPEGWGYGPKAVRGVAEILFAVKTAKNLDWANDVPQVREQATYLTYFAWPSLTHMDDQGTVRAGTSIKPSAQLASSLAAILDYMGDAPNAAVARSFAADVVATAGDDRAGWQKVLYAFDAPAAGTSYTARPLSYAATGPGHVAMRSSWAKDATWGALASGPYINAPDSGEEVFNAGSLSVVHGDDPILVNGTGWIPQVAGTAGEDFVYDDTWGTKQRKLYNTFFVADAANPYSPGQAGFSPDEAATHVERHDEGGAFVRARAAKVEQMYKNATVAQFTRDVVLARPGAFVIYDRTTTANASADQWLAFHLPSAPVTGAAADPTQHRLDVQKNGATIGSVQTLLPRDSRIATTALPGGVTAVEAHATSGAAEQTWLTVVTADGSPAPQTRISEGDGNVVAGGVVGVLVKSARNAVVLFPGAHAPDATTTSAKYVVSQSADADHVLVDVAPSASGYSVTTTIANGAITVDVHAGGSLQPTAGGNLAFTVAASGAVGAAAAPPADPTATTTTPATTPATTEGTAVTTTQTAPTTETTTATATASGSEGSTSGTTTTEPSKAWGWTTVRRGVSFFRGLVR